MPDVSSKISAYMAIMISYRLVNTMNLMHCRLLETLARTGSLRQAAEALGTSQPRLTQHLQKMERDLGAVLFHRSSGGLKLSEAGRTFLPFARRIRTTFESAQSAILEFGSSAPRSLRLGMSMTASLHLVPSNLLSFRERHPDVRVSVTRTYLESFSTDWKMTNLICVSVWNSPSRL